MCFYALNIKLKTVDSLLSSLETSFSLSLCLCQSVMNMMHVISIPYALMKVNPLSWIQKVCQYKGTKYQLLPQKYL